MPSLFVVRGRDQGKHLTLTPGRYLIGRESGSDLHLADAEASRRHAIVTCAADGHCELEDLGSSNGTKFNGRTTTKESLSNGDRIEIGSTLLIFTGRGGASPVSTGGKRSAALQVNVVPVHDGSRILSATQPPGIDPLSKRLDSVDPETGASMSSIDQSLEVMYLTAIAVGRGGDLDEVLQRVLRLVFDWVDADRGVIMLREEIDGPLKPAARCDRGRIEDTPVEQRNPIAISQTILQYVIDNKQSVRTSNASDDNRFAEAVSVVQGGICEALCVPLQGRYGVVGAMYVDTSISLKEQSDQLAKAEASGSSNIQSRFNDEHLRLITAIGHQAALAIEDTTYYSALVQNERLAAMGETIATISHHIKNILQGISGGGYLIEAGVDKEDLAAVSRGWQIVRRNQDRIGELVGDMLMMSKQRTPERKPASLDELVRDAALLIEDRCRQADVTLQVTTNINALLMIEPEAIHRSLLNVLSNAVDAVLDVEADISEPKIVVRTGSDTETNNFFVEVMDNGPGVSPEDRQRIFSLFQSNKGSRGTGIGLAVTAKIMDEHGGQIMIDDCELGGACFRLTLPMKLTAVDDVENADDNTSGTRFEP
ncbi:MAG: ATP-binding protein [Planctomycetota bacterium]